MSSLAVATALQALLAMVPRSLVPQGVLGATKRTGSRIEEADHDSEDPDNKFSLDINNETDSLTSRCYGVYGCFSIAQPYLSLARPINVFPLSVRDLTPKFCLYTRANPSRCQLRLGDPGSVTSSNFRTGAEVKVLTHGYLEHGDKKWLKRMVAEFLILGDLNVIVLDWLSGSGPPYTQTVANIRLIGAILGRFILDLRDYVGVEPGHIHVVGHSLGAQLAGYTGLYLKERGASLGRITGLDPAEPYFEGTEPVVRLDPTDADLVDVIHTDAGPIITGGLGTLQTSGHLDFYPNGGIRMPGCGAHLIDSVAKEQGNIPYGIRRFIGCNHIRSYEYFTESINAACPFLSIECGSWEAYLKGRCWECGRSWERCARMGAHAHSHLNYTQPKQTERKMFLITGADSPFCTFHHRVSVVMSYSTEARLQGGDVGVFYLTLYGQKGQSPRIQLNQEEIFFEPGNVYTYMIGSADLGHLKHVVLEWLYVTVYYNPLTWRLLSQPVVHVNRIHIDSIEMQERYEFCGLDMPFRSGTRRQLEWQAACPEQAPSPGASFLGTLINFDVEDTIYSNIDAVNSGLNSLGNGQFISNLASSTNQVARELMESARRRIGARVNKRRREGEDDTSRRKQRRWRVWG
ncbi:pancreatic triacylglycerol lipase isoform X2 [Procambarus clarkii]|uniref:pancreatic triacylglycerol lipase isoform X2 n=1 Tax=Procambarus clarkii TaxID=6728 RepID=UPI0037433E73